MSNSVKIDILFAYKETGENFFKFLEEKANSGIFQQILKNVEDSVSQAIDRIDSRLKKVSRNISGSVGKLKEPLISIGISDKGSFDSLKKLNKSMEELPERLKNVQSEVAKIGNEANNSIETANVKLRTQTSILQGVIARASMYLYLGNQALGAFQRAIDSQSSNIFKSFFELSKASASEFFQNINDGIQKTINTWKGLSADFLSVFSPKESIKNAIDVSIFWDKIYSKLESTNALTNNAVFGVKYLGIESKVVLDSTKNIYGYADKIYNSVLALGTRLAVSLQLLGQMVIKIASLPMYFYFSSLLFKDAFEFFKRLIGIGNEALTPLGRASSLVTTIDTTLHSTIQYFSYISKSIIYIGGYFGGIFNSFLVFPAVLTNVFNILNTGISYFANNFLGNMGAVRGQLSVVFESFRRLGFEFGKAGGVIDALTRKNKVSLLNIPGQLDRVLGIGKNLIARIVDGDSIIDRLAKKIKSGEFEAFFNKISRLIDLLLEKIKSISKISMAVLKDSGDVFQEKTSSSLNNVKQKAISDANALKKNIIKISKEIPKSLQSFDFDILSEIFISNKRSGKGNRAAIISKTFSGELRKLFSELYKVSKQGKLTEGKENFLEAFIKTQFGAITAKTPNLEVLKKFVEIIIKAFEEELKSKMSSGAKFGDILVSVMNQSIRKGGEKSSLVSSLIKDLQTLFVASIKGKGFENAGSALSKTLARGIKSGAGAVVKEMDSLTKKADAFLPHSDSKLGALATLTKSGFMLPVTLVQGIKKGQAFLISAVDNIADMIVAALKPALEISFLAERTGASSKFLSSFEYAFAELGIKANDLIYPLQNIQKILTEATTIEQKGVMASLGINLDKARESAEPAQEVLLQMIEAVRKLPLESEKARKGLELLGVMSTSNLVNVFRKSRVEIEGLMAEGQALGGFWKDEFVNFGKSITSIWERLRLLKNFVFQEFLLPILPVLNDLSLWIFKFVRSRRADINRISSMVGDLFATFYKMIPVFFSYLRKDTDGALQFLVSAVYATIRTMINIVWTAISNFFSDKFLNVVLLSFGFVGDALLTWMGSLWSGIKSQIKIWLAELGKIMFDGIKSMLENVPDRLKKIIGLDNIESWALKSSKDTILQIENEIEKEKISVQKKFTELKDSAGKEMSRLSYTVGKVINGEKIKLAVHGIKAEIMGLAETFKIISKDTPFESEILGLIDRLGKKWEELGSKVEIPSKAFKEFGNVVSDISNSVNSNLQITNDLLRERALIVEQTRIRAGEGDQSFVEMIELEKKHEQEMIELKKLGASDEEINALRKAQILESDKKIKESQKKTNDLLRERALIVEQTRIRAREGDQSFVDMIELEKKHEQEMIELKKLGAEDEEIKALRRAQILESDKKIKESQKKQEEEKEKKENEYSASLIKGWQTAGQAIGNYSQAFMNLYELSGKKRKEFLVMAKAMAITEAIINRALGITKALAEGGPILGPILAASIGALGATQIAVIASQTVSGYADGGSVNGPSGIDVIPARLTKDEFVQPVASVSYYGLNFMEAIRRRLIPREIVQNLITAIPSMPVKMPSYAFSTGGLAQSNANGNGNERPIELNIVNFTDKQDMVDFLSSNQGQDLIVNAISARSQQVRRRLNIK